MLEEVEIDHEALDKVLRKFQIGITVQEALGADEGQIINGCLILKDEHYQAKSYGERTDFRSVLALRLRHVSKKMFERAENLVNVIMPEALGVIWDSFFTTELQNCYFPKLTRIGRESFQNCKLKELNLQNFPAVEVVDFHGFCGCPLSSVNLPNLVSVGIEGFGGCYSLRQFSAQRLQKIGERCFYNCQQLSIINCTLKYEDFACKKCDPCQICARIPECLRRGAVPMKLEQK